MPNYKPKEKEMEIEGQVVRIAFWDAIFCAVCVLASSGYPMHTVHSIHTAKLMKESY